MSDRKKRGETRYVLQVPVNILSGTHSFPAFTENISYRGLSLVSNFTPSLRSFIKINIALPKPTKSIELTGMVVHLASSTQKDFKQLIGIQLYANSDSILHQWNDFIVQITSKQNSSKQNEPPTTVIVIDELTRIDPRNSFKLDMPSGHLFVPTEQNLALGEKVVLHIKSSTEASETEYTKLSGIVIEQNRKPGNFGVILKFPHLKTIQLKDFLDFFSQQITD